MRLLGKRTFYIVNRVELAVSLKIGLTVATFHICFLIPVSRVMLGLRLVEADRVIVHELSLREVLTISVSFKVHWFVQNLLHNSNVGVITVVGHGDHRS